jgi:hypothetical protein
VVELDALGDGPLAELAARHRVTIAAIREALTTGPSPPSSRRTSLDLEEIRRHYEAGLSIAQVARSMGTSPGAVHSAMIRGGLLRRLQGPRLPGGRRGPAGRLDADEIRRRARAGETVAEIADAMNASLTGVRQVLARIGVTPRR